MSSRHAAVGTAGAADHGMSGGAVSPVPRGEESGKRRVDAVPDAGSSFDDLDAFLRDRLPVARGATSRVFRATHPRLRCEVAIKVLDERYRDDPSLRSRLEREARAIASVRDPGVLRIFDLRSLEDGRPALISEWLEGEDLEMRLRRDRSLPVAEAVEIARDVCLALAAAHRRGVLHRDVKPANVFLVDPQRYGRRAVLLNFGVARCEGEASETVNGGLLGTPAYMAPEQARDASSVDARADVYAVAALLFRMLAGEPPYEAADPWTTLQRLGSSPPRSLASLAPHVPTDVVAAVERALSRDPALRPESAAAFAAHLDASSGPRSAAESASKKGVDRGNGLGAVLSAGTVFVAASSAVAASTLPHPLRPEGIVLAVLLTMILAAAALVFVDRERRRCASSSTAIEHLAGLARAGLRGFAEASVVTLLVIGLQTAYELGRPIAVATAVFAGLLGMAIRIALARRAPRG